MDLHVLMVALNCNAKETTSRMVVSFFDFWKDERFTCPSHVSMHLARL